MSNNFKTVTIFKEAQEECVYSARQLKMLQDLEAKYPNRASDSEQAKGYSEEHRQIEPEECGGSRDEYGLMKKLDNEDLDPAVVSFSEDDITFLEDDVTFSEDDLQDITLEEVLRPFVEGEGSLEEAAEELEGVHEQAEEILEEHGDKQLSDLLPGADVSLSDFEDEDEARDTDYANDKDLSKFMDHVLSLYPAKIPRHDGTSTVGCERAISFLDRMNGDISRAIREDHDSVLDISKLEDIRVNIMRDVLVLKDHLGKLKKQIKDSHSKKASGTEAVSKKASEIPAWKSPSGKSVSYKSMKEADQLEKVATTPNNLVIAVSPFERAISGIMINAHISAGHPMEDVYGFLSEKYNITDREELGIMQLCMDSGFHIFKDRGSYSHDPSKDGDEKRGVDFVRNYFA